MDFELPEELAEVQKLAHDFAEKESRRARRKMIENIAFAKAWSAKWGELGFYGCLIPEIEGSVNIQKLIIAQDALGYRNANR
jgi:glutaryl-CoA dehydrogenase (non-decarboxylating)